MSEIPPTQSANFWSLRARLEQADLDRQLNEALRLLARRLAPDAAGVRHTHHPHAASRAYSPSSQRSRLDIWLLLLLLVIALIPSATVGLIIWHDYSGAMQILRDPATALNAALENRSATTRAKEARIAEPVTIHVDQPMPVSQGQRILLALRLEPAESVPPRSILVIAGLPRGAILSAGRPYSDSEWSLRPDETGGLSVRLPAAISGSLPLAITLLAADGTALATTSTKLAIAAQNPALNLRTLEADRISALLQKGRSMIAVGYFPGARAYFRRAAEAGSGEAALALAATYDSDFLAELDVYGIQADDSEAQRWYEHARVLGADDVAGTFRKLTRLAGTKDTREAGHNEPPVSESAAQQHQAEKEVSSVSAAQAEDRIDQEHVPTANPERSDSVPGMQHEPEEGTSSASVAAEQAEAGVESEKAAAATPEMTQEPDESIEQGHRGGKAPIEGEAQSKETIEAEADSASERAPSAD